MKNALICGAGRIGRGFLGQLLHQSGYELVLVDADEDLVQTLARRGRYRVEIAGAEERSQDVPLVGAIATSGTRELARAVMATDLLVTSVGAHQLVAVAQLLAPHLACRERGLDWLICENALRPAARIREALAREAPEVLSRLGLVETVILRSGMDPAPGSDPLTVRMSDWWTLPADADAFVGAPPPVKGLEPRRPFANELTRKLYTFNGLNGPIAYLGYRKGFRFLHEAATDPGLEGVLAEIHVESSHGLLAEFGGDPAVHRSLQQLAWNKYRDPTLADTIERNARDSLRKLGPTERLVGPAGLCLRHGRMPRAYARAIAAALRYDGSEDPGTKQVQEMLATGGVRDVLQRVCGLEDGSPLFEAVVEEWSRGGPS